MSTFWSTIRVEVCIKNSPHYSPHSPLSNTDSLVLTKCKIVAEGFSKFTSLVMPLHSRKSDCTPDATLRLLSSPMAGHAPVSDLMLEKAWHDQAVLPNLPASELLRAVVGDPTHDKVMRRRPDTRGRSGSHPWRGHEEKTWHARPFRTQGTLQVGPGLFRTLYPLPFSAVVVVRPAADSCVACQELSCSSFSEWGPT